jgi:hypothetical protein
MLGLLCIVFIFHFGVILGWIPNTIVWGGRIQTREQFLLLECISLLVNTAFLWIIAQRAAYVKSSLPLKGLKIVLWGMAGLYALNTLGNLMAITSLEKYLFTPLTFVSALLCVRLALGKEQD